MAGRIEMGRGANGPSAALKQADTLDALAGDAGRLDARERAACRFASQQMRELLEPVIDPDPTLGGSPSPGWR